MHLLLKIMKVEVFSIDLLPRFMARLDAHGEMARIVVGNPTPHGPVAATMAVSESTVSLVRQIARPLSYGPNMSITTQKLTSMLVHRLGSPRQHLLLGFENGVLVILCAENSVLVAAAQLSGGNPIHAMAFDDMGGILIVVTALGSVYRFDGVTGILTGERPSLIELQRYGTLNAGSEIFTCGFVPSSGGESRLMILYSSGQIDLFSTAVDTFLQPETNKSVTLPVLGAVSIITASYLCHHSRALYVGTFNGAVLMVPLDTLVPETVLSDCGGPISTISPIEGGVCVGTLGGRVMFKDSTIYEDTQCSIYCLEALNSRLPVVLAGTNAWSLILITL